MVVGVLSKKYSPGIDCDPEIEKGINHVLILKLEIESISGKEAIEMTRQRNFVIKATRSIEIKENK